MSVPSLISLGAALSLLAGPAVYPVTAPDTAGAGSGNGNGTLTQVLPLTTSTGDTTEVATGALTLSSSGDGGAAVSPMRQGILSTASDSDWAQNSAILTQPLQVNPFMVTALTWEDGPLPDDMHVYLRVEEGAGWSEWYLVDSDTGTGPDNATGPSGTDPFVTGGAEGIQIRVSGDASELPAGLSLQLIPSDPEGEVKIDEDDVAVTSAKPTDLNEDSQKDAATDAPSGTIPSPLTGTAPLGSDDSAESLSPGTMQSGASTSGSGTGTGQSVAGALSTVFPASTTTNGLPVPVSSRADWGADESYMTWEPTYAAASHVIVHHTAGTNNYTMDQSASVVRGIYYYHAVTMGWGDIGYNFLVDKWGRAFEGRSGSLASTAGQMAVGAHDQGFNTGTMGVSMMGDYSSVTPSQATLDTVGKLASWQLKRAGVDPTGSADFVNVGANSKYPKGSHVNLSRISGHRDTYYTECPGAMGYAQLPEIRSIAAAASIDGSAAGSDPVGNVESVHPSTDGAGIALSGWAFDKDTTSPINVDVYVDSTGTRLTANKSRTDIQRTYGLSTDTVGFSATIPTTPGTHTVCIAAINTGGGTNQWLKCTTLTITSSGFNAGSIMSDEAMFNAGTMDEPAIADFLRSKGATCKSATDGTACLKDYRTTSTTMSYAYCSRYTGEENESSAHVIAKAASLCGVNPQVLIAMLQKEQGLVTASGSGLSAQTYQKAMGLGCPDSGDCSADHASFAAQVYGAASRLVQYGKEPGKFTYRAGQTATIAYSPTKTCGGSTVAITNRATAALYNYTPYQPNPAALNNLYGTGDSCSSYGNRNLWRNFRDWFGSPK